MRLDRSAALCPPACDDRRLRRARLQLVSFRATPRTTPLLHRTQRGQCLDGWRRPNWSGLERVSAPQHTSIRPNATDDVGYPLSKIERVARQGRQARPSFRLQSRRERSGRHVVATFVEGQTAIQTRRCVFDDDVFFGCSSSIKISERGPIQFVSMVWNQGMNRQDLDKGADPGSLSWLNSDAL